MLTKKILIMEDNRVVLDVISKGLKHAGFEVQACIDGIDGLRCFNALKPDIVISDIRMPGLNGNQVASTIRENDGHNPLMICIAGDISDANTDYFDIIFQKPVAISEVIRAINRSLDIGILEYPGDIIF